MDILTMLANGFSVSLSIANLVACGIGVLLGTLVGVLPGIGPLGAIALLLPFSISMDVTSSLILFAGIYYGTMFGGSTTSILLNVPGESSSVVTCIDGYAMARKGRAGAALAVAAIGSFIAGTLGVLGLSFFAPMLAEAALAFGPPEYFALAVLGLIILARLTGGSTLKAAFMVVIGIILGTVGMDSLSGIGRFTLDIDSLQGGLEFSVIVMGLFGVAEILEVMIRPSEKMTLQTVRFRDLYPNAEEWRRSLKPIFRGGVIGFVAGLIPGPAATVSTFVSYAVEKRLSKQPQEFGKGAIEGVAGPESANNAAATATMVPLLSLGLPFTPASAILLSGFMLHNVIPGPTLVSEKPDLFWGLIASMYIGNVLLLIINLPLVGLFAYILKTPLNILMPTVLMLTMVGAYSINNSIFELWLLIIFGIIGFFLKRTGYEPSPLIIGFILGPTLERGLVQGLIIGNGEILSLFTRPISGTLLVIAISLIFYNLVSWIRSRYGNKRGQSAPL